ncbi:MAG: maleylacetoacetate isomerase [Pseudomonadota bacterium]
MATLYDYPRSSAAYRVRIACNLKVLPYETVLIDFFKNDQRSEEFLNINPSGLAPVLAFDDGPVLSQSLAIMKYLDAIRPDAPLFPADPKDEAAVWEMALIVACDIHPLNNLRVLKYLKNDLGADEAARNAWYANWVRLGFEGLEARVKDRGGPYCLGADLTAVDVCLVPQMFNARRFNVPLEAFPTLVDIDARLQAIEAFASAAPPPA